MKFFADASYLGNVYYPGGDFAGIAQRLRKSIRAIYSPAVRIEFRLGALWNPARAGGWSEFLTDEATGQLREEAVIWDTLFSGFEATVLQYGRAARPDLLDGLHVLAARQLGATHFLSFDHRTRQRAFARSCGLKVLPERLPGEN